MIKFKIIKLKIKRVIYSPYTMPAALIVISMFLLITVVPLALSHIVHPQKTVKKAPPLEAVEAPKEITVYRNGTNTVETLDFEEYIKGVVSCEMPSSFHEDALKAQAVAARTYSTAKALASQESGNPQAHPQAPLCDTTHCQVFKTRDELKSIKGSAWIKNDYKKISQAVETTKGEMLYYNGNLVKQALFHSSSGGMTEDSEDVFTAAVPYLVSVESPYESEATHQNEEKTLSIYEFANAIKAHYPATGFGEINPSTIKIISRTSGNRVDKMLIGSATLTGRQVREALGLYSANFNIRVNDDNITFISKGSGHGVGLSQYGADGMAKEGYDYKKILSHYYSGTEVH